MSSLVESLIDFSDEDIPKEVSIIFYEKLKKVQKKIFKSIKSAKLSSFIKEGYTVAIIGKPNVGKSSLINTLTKLDTSIVSDIPGTTRDIIHQKIDLKGLPVILYDTAGIRKTNNKVEQKGVELALKIINKSNISIKNFLFNLN